MHFKLPCNYVRIIQRFGRRGKFFIGLVGMCLVFPLFRWSGRRL